MSIIQLFKRGEVFAFGAAAQAKAPEGMDERELALAVLVAKGMDADGCSLRKAVACYGNNFSAKTFKTLENRMALRFGIYRAGLQSDLA